MGYYSALVIYPVDNLTFWLYNEYPTLLTLKPPISNAPLVLSSWSTFACSYILNSFMPCIKSNEYLNQKNESINHSDQFSNKNNSNIVEIQIIN